MHDNERSHSALRPREYFAMENIWAFSWPGWPGWPEYTPEMCFRGLDGITITRQLKDLVKFHWNRCQDYKTGFFY